MLRANTSMDRRRHRPKPDIQNRMIAAVQFSEAVVSAHRRIPSRIAVPKCYPAVGIPAPEAVEKTLSVKV